jgi:hypothetical protein
VIDGFFFDEYGLFEAKAGDLVSQARKKSCLSTDRVGTCSSGGDAAHAVGSSSSTTEPPMTKQSLSSVGNDLVNESVDTNYVHVGSRTDLVVEESQQEFHRRAFKRKQWQADVQDTIGGAAGGNHFDIESSLRVRMLTAQRADASLAAVLQPLLKAPPKGALKASDGAVQAGFRLAVDGVLEKSVSTKGGPAWVPVVPNGEVGTNATWKWWCFLQCHIGIFGGHRLGDQTYELMARIVWWASMFKDVKRWADECDTCIRFRKKRQKSEQVPMMPVGAECWQEVMVDIEGPCQPGDYKGNTYVLTYMCLLCHGVFFEPIKELKAPLVRMAFSKCLFRSGTVPMILRTDRGQEFRNALITEYIALMGIRHRFGAPFRPVEQAPVERIHQEKQKLLGILVTDVLKCNPEEWSDLLHVVEYLIYTTPGPYGFTPRDIDRRWSSALKLEKDLQPFQVCEFEPVTDYARNLFAGYRRSVSSSSKPR